MPPIRPPMTQIPLNRLALLAAIIGVGTGLLVSGLNWAIIGVEHLVYDTDHFQNPDPTSNVSPIRLSITLVVVGILTSWAWYLLHRLGEAEVSVIGAMRGEKMPLLKTLLSAFLQVGSVASGAPVGQENAPRLAGGLVAERFGSWLALDLDAKRILVAAAAGAGLGASFHLPLAGALFALEILLVEMSTRTVIITMVTSGAAVTTAGIFVRQPPIFQVGEVTGAPGMLVAAVLVGVAAGLLGHWFGQGASRVVRHAPRGVHILWQMPLGFLVIAAIAYLVPAVTAHSRWAASTALNEQLPLLALLLIAALRAVAILLAFRVGTVGGTLLPAFALGAIVGAIVGNVFGPLLGVSAGAFALMGAAAFLSTTMAAPMFGMIAAIEFTDVAPQGYLPVFLAVIVAVLTVRLWGVVTDREQRAVPMTYASWTGELRS